MSVLEDIVEVAIQDYDDMGKDRNEWHMPMLSEFVANAVEKFYSTPAIEELLIAAVELETIALQGRGVRIATGYNDSKRLVEAMLDALFHPEKYKR